MLKNPKTCDLEEAAAPEDVVQILRNAAEKYNQSWDDLQSAWQEREAGHVWSKIAKRFESLADSINKHLKEGSY